MGRVSLGLRAHHMLTAGRGAHGGFDVASCDINTIFGEILKLICKLLGGGGEVRTNEGFAQITF